MSLHRFSTRLDRITPEPPRCYSGPVFLSYREGDTAPVFPVCPRCGLPGCGVTVVQEMVIVERRPDGSLVSEQGTVLLPERVRELTGGKR